MSGFAQKQANAKRSNSFASVLVPLESANNSGIILDISPESDGVHSWSYKHPLHRNFLDPGGVLKPVSEMAAILGDAGISQDDAVLIYGECQPCGGGPSAATYVYWIMKYLGHKNVKLLDGGIDDWVAALRPTPQPRFTFLKNYITSHRGRSAWPLMSSCIAVRLRLLMPEPPRNSKPERYRKRQYSLR